jgi:hypothetical protein
MKQILRIALVACLLALTTPAWAHAPIMGIHGVFGGLLHALLASDVLLAATGILGLLIAAGWGPPILGWPLAAVAGLAFALDSAPETTSTDEAIRMLIGSGLGAIVALALVAEGAVLLRSNGQPVVARVLDSWIAATVILVLALRIATRFATG